MVQKLIVLSGLLMSATCMVLHQAPLPLYIPIQYQEPAPNYNFAYEVNDAHTGDYKRQQETRVGDTVLGAYSLLQPDGLTRTVEYRADDHSGFNAVVNNVGRQNVRAENQENGEDASARRSDEKQSQQEKPRQSNDQQSSQSPATISHTSLVHHVLRNW